MKTLLSKTLLLLSGILIGIVAKAQQDSQQIGIRVGVMPFQLKDNFHWPYPYIGTGIGLQATYLREKASNEWEFAGSYSQLNPQSIVSRPASAQHADVLLNYRWRLVPAINTANGLRINAGVGLRLFGLNMNYTPDLEASNLQLNAGAAIGGSVSAGYQISPSHSIRLSGFASAISAIYRPTYAYYGKELFTITWLGQNPTLEAQFSYSYRIHKSWQATLHYQLNYFKYNQPQSIIMLHQYVGVGFQKSF